MKSFLDYIKNLFLNNTFGLSETHYPQTVQHFLLLNFQSSFFLFLPIWAVFFFMAGAVLFFQLYKKNMASDFSELSIFLRMSEKRVKKQAIFAAIPAFLSFFEIAAPIAFLAILACEYFFAGSGSAISGGLGGMIKYAFESNDKNLFYGGVIASAFTILIIASPLALTAICRRYNALSFLGRFFHKKWQ